MLLGYAAHLLPFMVMESDMEFFAAVLYAYEQCLLCYSHCAEIWYEAALYLQRASETGVYRMSC